MEGLLAYDSGSSSEESDESPKKKPKVTESDNIIIYAGSSRKTENGKLESHFKPGKQYRLFPNNLTESKQIVNACNSLVSTQNDFCEPLIDDKHKTSACGYFRTSTEKNTKSAALFDSGNQKTKSSSISSGSNVKPYVSKRQKEKLAQAISSSLMANHPSQETDLTLRNSSLKGANYHPDDAKFLNRKGTDQVCKPSKKLHLNLKGHTQGVNCIRWNVTESNNHLLVSASMDRTVCVWDTRQGGGCMQSLTCHTEAVKDAKWSHCGSQVLSCGYDKTARLFDVETGKEIKVCPHRNYVTCVQFHPSNPNLFLAGTFKSSILCWDRRTGSTRRKQIVNKPSQLVIFLALDTNKSGQAAKKIPATEIASTYSALFGQVQDIAFLPGAEEFVSAAEVVRRNSTDKGIMVWDFRSTAVLSNQIYQEAFTCTCLKVHPYESHFVAQSNGDYIALFSTRKPYKLNKFKRYEGHKVCGYHIGCDFSPDGKIICSGSADGKIFFYDHSTAHVMRTIEAHSAPCTDVAYHPTLPSWVATCGWDGQVKIWT